MGLALALALQAAAPTAPPAPAPIDFDLATYRPSEPDPGRCASDEGEEIVVCGRRQLRNEYPLEEMERLFGTKPLIAETSIGGGATARAFVDSVEMPGGQISKRAMVGIKMRF
jgi:hypothetical protein